MLEDLITPSLFAAEVMLIIKALIKESAPDPGFTLYAPFQGGSWKISRSQCALFDQTSHRQPVLAAGFFGGLLEVMLHLHSTSSTRSCRSELGLWKKKAYLLEIMDFQQFWKILMVTQFHIQHTSTSYSIDSKELCAKKWLTSGCKLRKNSLRVSALVLATYRVSKYALN